MDKITTGTMRISISLPLLAVLSCASPGVRESGGFLPTPASLEATESETITEARPQSLGRRTGPPRLPSGMEAIVVPAVVSEPRAVYRTSSRPAGSGEITAYDLPKPARATPKGRGHAVDSSVDAARELEAGPAGIGASQVAPLAPPLTSTFDSTFFDENSTLTGFVFIPPDPHASAGIDHLVNVVNTTIRFHSKAGVTIFHEALEDFFAPLVPLTATFDPKVIYDQFADRFVVVTLEQTDTAFGDPADTSRIFVAVSDDGDPNGTWTMSAIPSTITIGPKDYWADYPGFAVDEEAVYITANMFGFFGPPFAGAFGGVRLWILDKGLGSGGFYDGGGAVVNVFDPYAGIDGAAEITTQPAHVFCSPGTTCPATVGTYLVSYSGLSNMAGTDFVQSVRVDSPLGTPTFSQQFIAIGDIEPLVAALPPAPQSGSNFPIATNDRRALNAVWRDDDSLWMTATIDPNAATSPADVGEATAHWWQLDTTTLGAITLVQQGNISGDTDIATDTFTFFPSIAVNSANDVAIGFSASAASIFAGSYYTTRVAGDLPGFTEPAVALRAGLATYERTFDGSGGCSEPDSRWGDYSGISVDPSNECFWVYNEHALTRGLLTTGVCGVLPPADMEDGRWGTAYGEACMCDSTLALPMGVTGGGGWEQISMTCDPGPADTVADVVGDDLAGTYGTDWIMHRRDESIPGYVALTLTDSLVIGEGYWIKTLLGSQSIAMGGKVNTLTDIPLTGVAVAPPAGCAGSAGQCNKVGHPHNFDVCWADVLVDDGGIIKTLATVDPSGSCQTTGTGCIMSRIAHKWTGSAYAPFDGTTLGMEGTLVAWDGFWVSANKPDIELRIPATQGSCGAPARVARGGAGDPAIYGKGKPGTPWFIRLRVLSGDLEDSTNVFGQLPSSKRGYDGHDLEELDPFGADYLTIVFPHPDWGAQAGNYSSDYHRTQVRRINDEFQFEIRSSAGGRAMLLWEGPKALLKKSTLIDNDRGRKIKIRKARGGYGLVLDSGIRSFTWRIRSGRPRGR